MTKRIEFIDLAKGVCIILLILGHCGVPMNIPCINAVVVPLYYTISGLFFSSYGTLPIFVKKKINRLLVPFLFFYLVGYCCFYLLKCFLPNLLITGSTGVLDIFTQYQYFNGPIWFLLCLFWTNLIFYIISVTVKNEYIKTIIVLLLGSLGIALSHYDIFVPCMIAQLFTAMPLFYFGYILRKTNVLYPQNYDKWALLIAIVLYIVAIIVHKLGNYPAIGFHNNSVHGSALVLMITAMFAITATLFFCKAIGHLPFVSYFGRYSIIPLCIHHLVYRPVAYALTYANIPYSQYVTAVITVLVCWACIPLCIKYLPHVTAQKEIFPTK